MWSDFFTKFAISSVEVLGLFLLILFVIQFFLSYINTEKIKAIIERLPPLLAHVVASIFGAVTPFCTCSGIPIFTGLIRSGVPAGVAFSFLITSPLVNEIALAAIFAIFGIKTAVIYTIFGLLSGILGGMILGKMKVERYFKSGILAKKSCCGTNEERLDTGSCCSGEKNETGVGASSCGTGTGIKKHSISSRLAIAWKESMDIIIPVLPYLFVGMAIGVAVTTWVSTDWIQRLNNYNQFVLIPMAIVMGAPIYTSITAVIPIVGSLVSKGMGTGLAFALIMSIGGMSFPEWAILSGIMKKRLLFSFIGITGLLIMLISYIFALLDMLPA